MNERGLTPLGRRVLWTILTLVLVGVFALPALAADYYLDTPGTGALIDDIIIVQFTPDGTEPAGGMDPFLSINGQFLEEGYNTDGALELNTVEPTKAILLSQVPSVNLYGADWREFALDIEEYSFLDASGIVLDHLRFGISDQPNLSGWDGQTVPGLIPLWAMDASEDNDVVMDAAMGTGPGNPDYLIYFPEGYLTQLGGVGPECAYGSGTCTTYIYVYAYFGLADGGNETFGVGAQGLYTEPSTLVVHKVTDPQGVEALFDFQVSLSTAPDLPTFPMQLPANQSGGLVGILPGTYAVTEAEQPGWMLANITPDDPTGDSSAEIPTASMNLAPGETAQVTFENWQLPVAIACKEDTEGNPLEGWTINVYGDIERGPSAPSERLLFPVQTGADGCVAFRLPVTGTYTLREEIDEGWHLISPEENGILVEATEELLYGPYTFVNFEEAVITACKQDDQQEPLEGWVINLEGPASADASKTDEKGCTEFVLTAPGTYTLTEEAQDGWIQASPEEGYFVFEVASGGEYSATFINEPERGDLDVQKHVSVDSGQSWDDADEAPGPSAPAGSQVVWFKYTVTNIGNVEISNITLDDDVFGTEISNTCNISTTLLPEESTECEIGPFVAVVGQHTNTATSTATWDDGVGLKAGDNANYFGATSGLLISKVVDWTDAEVDETKVFTLCVEGPLGNGEPEPTVAPSAKVCLAVDYDGGTVGWSELLPGTYQISEEYPGEIWFVEMSPSDGVVVLEPEARVQTSITNTYQISSISDRVWYDENGNGLQDETEQGLADATVSLYVETEDEQEPQLSAWALVGQQTTGADGLYLFSNLLPGRYYLHFALPEGYNITRKDVGADDAIDSDAEQGTGNTDVITLPLAVDDDTWDCGAAVVVGAGVELDPPKPWADPACVGWKLSWDLVFTNTSTIPLNNVRLVNYHPDVQVDAVVDGGSPDAALDVDGHIYWDIAVVAPGERVQRVAELRLWTSIVPDTVITDCAKVFTDYGETDLTCGEATVIQCVRPSPTATVTPTSTRTPTRTATPTATSTPTITLTPKPGGLFIPLLFR